MVGKVMKVMQLGTRRNLGNVMILQTLGQTFYDFLTFNSLNSSKRLGNNRGVQRGFTPLPRAWGVSPSLKFPQDWGTEGVE